MPDRVGYLCPCCGSIASQASDRDCALCPNRDCVQFSWKPNWTREQNLANQHTI